jgi:hypothetical protein
MEAIINALKLLVPDSDVLWLENIRYESPDDLYDQLTDYSNNKTPVWLLEQTLWNRTMSNFETLEEYINDIEKVCTILQKSER